MASLLAPHHLKMLREGSGIADDVIEGRGYRTVTDKDELATLGFDLKQCRAPGLLIPLHAPGGDQPLYVYRPDNPRVLEHRNKGRLPDGTYPNTVLKYEFPKGAGMRLDCPPTCLPTIGDPEVPLWITEGTKKGDALASLGLCVITVQGVWNWRGKNSLGGRTVLADWEDVALKGREVNIVFDSDIMAKEPVRKATERLGGWLANRGAIITTIVLPAAANGGKQGVDDYLVSGKSVADLEALVHSQRIAVATLQGKNKKPKSSDYLNALISQGFHFRMNELDDSIELNGERLTDPLRAYIRSHMRDHGFTSMAAMEDVYTAYAHQCRYHPIREYLSGLEWNGDNHIAHLAGHLLDTHSPIEYDDGLIRSVTHAWLLRWLVGAVAKVFDATQNMMLVLDGKQDIGKSYFARWLGSPLPGYYVEGPINPDDKDTSLRMISTWVWEVAELGSTTRRADREALKHIITAQEFTVRPPYGRHDIKKPALASLIGTINNEAGFLNDPTGNRRFLVTTLAEIEWSYTQLDVSQVWAQAVALYRAGESPRLLPVEKAVQRQLNGGYEIDDPMQDWVLEHFELTDNPEDFLPTNKITEHLQDRGMRGNTISLGMKFSATALRMGLTKARKPGGGPRGYTGIRIRPLGMPTGAREVGTPNGKVGTAVDELDEVPF